MSALAGCSSGDEDEPPDTTEPADGQTPAPGEEPGTGEVTFAVEPSGTEIDWGEPYSVSVSGQAGEDPPQVETVIVYRAEGDDQWSVFSGVETFWRFESGESKTESYEIQPPTAGELTLALMKEDQSILDEWTLTVNPPQAVLGETISYYDGLDVTVDASIQEALEVMIADRDEDIGEYEVTSKDGKWGVVSVVVENTTTNTDLRPPSEDDFNAIAGAEQLDDPKYSEVLGEDGSNERYEVVGDHPEFTSTAGFVLGEEDEYFDPPNEMIPDVQSSGSIYYVTDPATTVEDISVRLNYNQIRAKWE